MLNSKDFMAHIDPHIVIIHEDAGTDRDTCIIRFTNGFGVKILKPMLDVDNPSLFVVMVLKFHGSRIRDYQLAQYTYIPEVNWLEGHADVLELCREVSGLPAHGRERNS
jgi:hypothetical protein